MGNTYINNNYNSDSEKGKNEENSKADLIKSHENKKNLNSTKNRQNEIDNKKDNLFENYYNKRNYSLTRFHSNSNVNHLITDSSSSLDTIKDIVDLNKTCYLKTTKIKRYENNEESKNSSNLKKWATTSQLDKSISQSLILTTSTKSSIRYSAEDREKIKNIVCKKLKKINREGFKETFNLVHEDVICAICSKSNFVIDRYKCLICRNYNLCGNCFEERKFNRDHKKEHAMVRFSGPNELFGEEVVSSCIDYQGVTRMLEGVSHDFSSCNGCGCDRIIGPRFKCDECIDFNLCIKCYERKKEKGRHKSDHCILVYDSLTNIKSSDVKVLKEIGKGSFGTVYKARLIPKNKIIACKIIEYELNQLSFNNNITERDLSNSFERESRAYNEINSNFVLKIYGCFIESNQDHRKFYILTEYMEKGALHEVINKEKDLSYRLRLSMACNIASGLRRMHEKGFIHRDLRPYNILVNNDYVAKICDMGLAKIQQDPSLLNSAYGCIPYMPKEAQSRKFSEKLDIYSFGLVLYHLFFGQKHSFGFNGGVTKEIKLPETVPVFAELINECLNDSADKRPSAKTLNQRLNFYYEIQTDYSNFENEDEKEFFIKVYNLTTDALIEMN